MDPIVQTLVIALVALMIYSVYRLGLACYALVRDGMAAWQGRRVLEELQAEVDSGRRTPFELFIQHGLHHLQLHDALRARAFFEAAANAHPMSPQGFYGQGLAWHQSLYFAGPLQEQALRTALERDPHHADARLLLIDFYAQSGLAERAREQYQQLPSSRQSDDLARVLETPMVADEPKTFVRAGTREKCYIVFLDTLLTLLLCSALDTPSLLAVAGWLGLFLVPYHALLAWRLTVDMDGLELRTLLGTKRMAWKEVTDLVGLEKGGFFLLSRDRTVFVSNQWDQFGALQRTVKHHLYARGWIPLLREYGSVRRRRPLLS